MNQAVEAHETGSVVGAGSFVCVKCGSGVSLEATDPLPECPGCGGSRFRRASLFEQPTLDTAAVEPGEAEPEWLADAREKLPDAGVFLALWQDGATRVVPIAEGWTRIGRSVAADVRLDDPTVSRRHALIVRTPEGEIRALDDRSLNGVFVNGERVEWGPLHDGDELTIGRFQLHVVEV